MGSGGPITALVPLSSGMLRVRGPSQPGAPAAARAAGWDPGPGPGPGSAGCLRPSLPHRARAGHRAGLLTEAAAQPWGPGLRNAPLPHPPGPELPGHSELRAPSLACPQQPATRQLSESTKRAACAALGNSARFASEAQMCYGM